MFKKKPVNTGINYQPQLVDAGVFPSTIGCHPSRSKLLHQTVGNSLCSHWASEKLAMLFFDVCGVLIYRCIYICMWLCVAHILGCIYIYIYPYIYIHISYIHAVIEYICMQAWKNIYDIQCKIIKYISYLHMSVWFFTSSQYVLVASVDGSEIVHQLITSLCHYLQGFIHCRCRISEPSTVCSDMIWKSWPMIIIMVNGLMVIYPLFFPTKVSHLVLLPSI